MTERLFVYGTLLAASGSPVRAAIAESLRFLSRGSMRGRLYEVGGYPGAVASVHPDELVYGEIYALSSPEQVLGILDAYEECTPQFPQPHEYRRKRVRVFSEEGKWVDAWVYLYNLPVAALERIESGDYAAYALGSSST